jgi:S1-C subfamily serine protease
MMNAEVLARLAGRLGGLPILGCRPNSPAARAGIRYGDILLSVNGRPTPDWASYIEARGQGGEMVVEYFRAGAIITERLELPERTEPVDPRALLLELAAERAAPLAADGDPEPEPS